MENNIVQLVSENGWKSRKPSTSEELQRLIENFGKLPEDYLELMKFSNGGSLYGFNTPLIVYSILEVMALYKEHDLYENIPETLIFGGDGGGKIYCFDLRNDDKGVLIYNEDTDGYDDKVNSATSLTDLVKRIIGNEKVN